MVVAGHSGSGRTPGDALSSDWLGERARTAWRSARTRSGPAAGCRPACSPRPRATGRAAGYYLMVLSAHAGLAYLAAAAVARDLYLRGYSRVQGGRVVPPPASACTRSTRSSTALFFFLPRPIRLLILKDLRTFRRDPAQWSQFLIFFGLLAFYFLNIPPAGLRGADRPPGGTSSAS